MTTPGGLSRRHFVLAGLGAMVAGCVDSTSSITSRPRPSWPSELSHPQPDTPVLLPRTPAHASAPAPTYAPAPTLPTPQPSAPTLAGLNIVPRSSWTNVAPIRNRLNPLGGINRITVHHEGWKSVWFDDWAQTAARLREVQTSHMNGDHNWGDIGYHFIIDRAGRVIEARPLTYQGAHVKNYNENNLGVMVLGNFEQQSPSNPQLASVRTTVQALMRRFSVPVRQVFTHQELNPTQCPGKNFQPIMVAMRQRGYLVG